MGSPTITTGYSTSEPKSDLKAKTIIGKRLRMHLHYEVNVEQFIESIS